MSQLDGKVAIVTGGGRGLGRAAARVLADAGAAVVVASRNAADLDRFAAEVQAAGGSALACRTDVTEEASVQHLVNTVLETFGRIDILVNNSGILTTRPLLDTAPKEWDEVIATNLRGVYLTTQAVGRVLVGQKSGKVINIASNFALQGVPNHAAYTASKAGVIGFTRSVAVEWARYNVQVNAIAPGYFSTDMNATLRADEELTAKVVRAIPARRMGRAEELEPWLLLLAGRASDFMIGEVIVIDGGQTIH